MSNHDGLHLYSTYREQRASNMVPVVMAVTIQQIISLSAAGMMLLRAYAALLVTCPHPLAGSPSDDPLIIRRLSLSLRGLLAARPASLTPSPLYGTRRARARNELSAVAPPQP